MSNAMCSLPGCEKSDKLKRCGACRQAQYCSTEHQHRLTSRPIMTELIILLALCMLHVACGEENLLSYVLLDVDQSAINDPYPYHIESTNQVDDFGDSLCSVGDIDKNGYNDFVVGSGGESSAIHIVLTTVNYETLSIVRYFDSDIPVSSLAGVGDMDGDDVVDIAVGSIRYIDEIICNVYIYYLTADGDVKDVVPIGEDRGESFGASVVSIGSSRIAVAAPAYNYGDLKAGAVYLVTLDSNGMQTNSDYRISSDAPQLAGHPFLTNDAGFGTYPELNLATSDLNQDGVEDLVVSARENAGAHMHIFFLTSDGTVVLSDDGYIYFQMVTGGSSIINAHVDWNHDGFDDFLVGQQLGRGATDSNEALWQLSINTNTSNITVNPIAYDVFDTYAPMRNNFGIALAKLSDDVFVVGASEYNGGVYLIQVTEGYISPLYDAYYSYWYDRPYTCLSFEEGDCCENEPYWGDKFTTKYSCSEHEALVLLEEELSLYISDQTSDLSCSKASQCRSLDAPCDREISYSSLVANDDTVSMYSELKQVRLDIAYLENDYSAFFCPTVVTYPNEYDCIDHVCVSICGGYQPCDSSSNSPSWVAITVMILSYMFVG